MKRPMMMIVAGIATLASMATARAQSPDSTPPKPTPPPLPTTIPDVSDPASPSTPTQTGSVPPLATPEALPPPAMVPVYLPAATPYPVEGGHGYPGWMSKAGAAVMLGGGYEDFTQAPPRAATSGGGSWDARLAAGPRQYVGLEAAYVGGARTVNGLGFAPNTTLSNNGFEGNLRVNIPLVAGAALIEPFAFVGVGWQAHYSLSKTVVTADVTQSDNVMTVPFGAGLMLAYGMFMVDARVSWRETYYNDMFVATGSKLTTWGAGGNIGVEYKADASRAGRPRRASLVERRHANEQRARPRGGRVHARAAEDGALTQAVGRAKPPPQVLALSVRDVDADVLRESCRTSAARRQAARPPSSEGRAARPVRPAPTGLGMTRRKVFRSKEVQQ